MALVESDADIARRSTIQHAVADCLARVTELIDSTSCPSQMDSRRFKLLYRALSEIELAMDDGDGVDKELLMLCALGQSWLEANSRRRAL
jgi:hypothetical protein